MDDMKLKVFRFGDGADATTSLAIDINAKTKGIKEATKDVEDLTKSLEQTINSTETLDKTMSKQTKFSLFAEADKSIQNFKSAMNKMRKLASSDIASPKFKIDSSMKSANEDLTNYDITKMSIKDIQALNRQTATILKANQTEYEKQTKEIEKQIAEEEEVINKEKERKNVINELFNTLSQAQNQMETEMKSNLTDLANTMSQLQQQKTSTSASPENWEKELNARRENISLMSSEQKLVEYLAGVYAALYQANEAETSALERMKNSKGEIIGYDIKLVNGMIQTNYQYDQSIIKINKFSEQIDKFKSTLLGSLNVIAQTGSIIEQFDNKMKKIFNTLKTTAVSWRIVYGTFSQIWNMLSNTVESAADYEESLNLYTVALGKYAEQARSWVTEISDALYLDPSNIMQYTGALYNLVEGYGVTSEAAYKMSTNLTQLAYDMSSYLNIDVEAAYTKLQSAMSGQSRAVATAGIAMQNATLSELAYSLGIEKNISDMTQAEKAYLRYIQIMRSTINMQGDLARTIITPANAIRVIKQQFVLLGRAIGQVFIPIVMKAIPYVMALTQMLTRLAASLGAKLGYKVADVDYSGIVELDNYLENTGKLADSAGKKSKKAANDISRSLAPFDELNVVESSSSKTKGAGSGLGADDSIIGDLEKYIDGYDMLKDLTSSFEKQVDAASKNLKNLGKILGTILGFKLATKAFKLASNLKDLVDKIKDGWENSKGFGGVLKTLTGRFAEAYSEAKALGEGGLMAVSKGFQSALGPVGKFFTTLGLSIASFVTAKDTMSEYDGTWGTLAINIGKAAIEIGAFTAAAALFTGSGGAIVAGIAGIAGGFLGLIQGIEDYYEELSYQERYNTLFDGMGISIDLLREDFDEGITKIVEYTDTLDSLKTDVDNTSDKFDNARDNFEKLHQSIAFGKFDSSENVIAQMKEATDELKNSIEENKQSHIDYYNTVYDNLSKIDYKNATTYESMKKDSEKYYTWLALSQSEYADKLRELDALKAANKITDEEYDAQLQNLNNDYLGIIDTCDDAAASMSNMYYIAAGKIDLKNPEALNSLVNSLKESYDKGSKSLEEQKRIATETYTTEKLKTEESIAVLQQRIDKGKKLTEQQQQTYDKQKEHLDKLGAGYESQMDAIESQAETLGGTYKNYLLTIYSQISEAGMLGADDVKESVGTIKKEMDGLGNYDSSKSVADLFSRMKINYLAEGKTFADGTIQQFQKWGENFSDAELEGFLTRSEKNAINRMDWMDKQQPKYEKFSKDNGYEIGKQSMIGEMKGLEDYKGKVFGKSEEIANGSVNSVRDKLGIHSPSTVFAEIGRYCMEGLIKGLDSNSNGVIDKISNLTSKIQQKMSSISLSLNINTNVEGSFNSILNKLQRFATNWKNGINDLMNKTSKAFNSISLGFGSKLIYTAMSGINIAKFADGGFPTSGDLFFANEGGRAEYIASVGNKTAVANQDQMATVITNAVIAGFNKLQPRDTQPGITQVYIGNDKVYEGHGKYQNRQSDRYGTTYVKV